MKEKIIIIRYSEIHLKGKNRGFFERLLTVNLERSLKGLRHELRRTSGRYLVEKFDQEMIEEIESRIANVFGVHSYSVGYKTESSLDKIFECALLVCPEEGTFKVDTHRGNKRFPLTSIQINTEIGGRLLSVRHKLKVDVHNPQGYVYIDVREGDTALIFGEFKKGRGGMPVGASGKGLLLISGGIDSPVAGYMMAKRGMQVDYLHFHSYPHTNELAKEKVISLAKRIAKFTNNHRLTTISVTNIQEEIHAKCAPELNVTLLRRFMFRLAQRLAKKRGLQCLITGESLGQVASQTIEGMTSSNAVVTLPVLRPLVAFDKDEIIEISREIGTYEISVEPYEDCCTVFLPDFPAIRPKLSFIESEEKKLDIEGLIEDALTTVEVIEF